MNTTNTQYAISVLSGKGGVGKSVLAANIAYILSQMNFKVLLWDTNRKFPNTHLIFGVEPTIRISEVHRGLVSVDKAIFRIDENLDLLADEPATYLTQDEDKLNFTDIYKELLLKTNYDFIIFDTSPGLNDVNFEVAAISDLIYLVITDEPTSLLDGYALIKVFSQFINCDQIKLIVNNAIDEEDGNEIAKKMNLATKKFLDLEIELAGIIPYSRIVRQSIIRQEIFLKTNPDDDISKSLKKLCDNLLERIGFKKITQKESVS